MSKPLPSAKPALEKAYKVIDCDEGQGGIVYAHSAREAKRLGAAQYGDGEPDYYDVERAPWADEFRYRAGGCSPIAMVQAGWRLECWGCCVPIDQDEVDDLELALTLRPVEVGGAIYCTSECCNRAVKHQLARTENEAAALQDLAHRLTIKFPGVWLTTSRHAYYDSTKGRVTHARVSFMFPGSQYGGTFGFDQSEDPTVRVCNGDLPAWQTFYAPEWKVGTHYRVGDVVRGAGRWRCIRDHLSSSPVPVETYWEPA